MKKRIALDVDEEDHKRLINKARSEGQTLANYIRQLLELPLERQGVKSETEKPKVKSKTRK